MSTCFFVPISQFLSLCLCSHLGLSLCLPFLGFLDLSAPCPSAGLIPMSTRGQQVQAFLVGRLTRWLRSFPAVPLPVCRPSQFRSVQANWPTPPSDPEVWVSTPSCLRPRTPAPQPPPPSDPSIRVPSHLLSQNPGVLPPTPSFLPSRQAVTCSGLNGDFSWGTDRHQAEMLSPLPAAETHGAARPGPHSVCRLGNRDTHR